METSRKAARESSSYLHSKTDELENGGVTTSVAAKEFTAGGRPDSMGG